MQRENDCGNQEVDAEFGQRLTARSHFNDGIQVYQGKFEQGQHRDERRSFDHQRRQGELHEQIQKQKQNHNQK